MSLKSNLSLLPVFFFSFFKAEQLKVKGEREWEKLAHHGSNTAQTLPSNELSIGLTWKV